MTGDIALGPGAEFDFIRMMLARWGARARGVGDDCAVLDLAPGMRLCVSADTSVEDVHFRRAWLTAREIGYRAAAAALSDLAAMAARPIGLLLALTLPDQWRAETESLAAGVGEAADAVGARILGGDLSRGRELSLTVTVLGEAAMPLARSGARPGDGVYVTGRLGGPAAAIAAWERGQPPSASDRIRFAMPQPRVREAAWLAEHGATACIDVSDGVLADAGHIASASGVGIEIELESLPCVDGVSSSVAIAAGEEYELLVTAAAPPAAVEFLAAFDVPLTLIGRVHDSGQGVGAWATERGARVAVARGHDHFSR